MIRRPFVQDFLGFEMATIAIGDVHGNLPALESLLEKVEPDLRPDDHLVFLGDLIDRGPDARGCVERIVALAASSEATVLTVLGNHEQWMLKSFHDPTSHSWLMGMNGLVTVESYDPEAAAMLGLQLREHGPALLTEKRKLSYELFFDAMPASHLALIADAPTFHRTDDVICAHAGVPGDGDALEDADEHGLVWGVTNFPGSYGGKLPVAFGHWDDAVLGKDGWPYPNVHENGCWGLDTISHGVLTAVRFPDETVIQSERFVLE